MEDREKYFLELQKKAVDRLKEHNDNFVEVDGQTVFLMGMKIKPSPSDIVWPEYDDETPEQNSTEHTEQERTV